MTDTTNEPDLCPDCGLPHPTSNPYCFCKPEAPTARAEALPDDLLSHRSAWRTALVLAEVDAEVTPPDIDDKAYWRHELVVFDRVFAAMALSAAPSRDQELTSPYGDNNPPV